jgi:GNAT superfamily N-acetyltransferase
LITMSSRNDYRLTGNPAPRRPTMQDAAAVAGLINICAVTEVGLLQTTVEQLRDRWQSPGFHLDTDSWVMVEPGGRIVGYVEVWDLHSLVTPSVWVCVHPDYTGPDLGRYLLRLAEDRARQALGEASCDRRVTLRTTIVSANQPARRLLYQVGYRLVSRHWCGGRFSDGVAPTPDWPKDFHVRAYISCHEEGPPYRYDIYEKELAAGGREPAHSAN